MAVNVFLPDFLVVLVVVAMESVDKVLGVILDKLVMLTNKLMGRPEALRPGEAVGGA